MKKVWLFSSLAAIICLMVACTGSKNDFTTIKPAILKDKIAGGWAGKMVGVTYGAPTEFRAQGRIYTDSILWQPSDIKGSLWQDDIYVQLTFLMTMDKYGIDAPVKKYQEMFATAGYSLWHANMQARKNWYDSIFAPLSGTPQYNIHADDIDFQIESDYIGFMCPAMPATAASIADRIGRIMNYGDGLYGGIFVAALYSEAFFEENIPMVIEKALASLPPQSDYYLIIKDVIKLHEHYPFDWQTAWQELENKWGDVDVCGAGSTFNIDAKLNGAYIAMGLLYGEGDPEKTLEISTRCGQDSDCNPSNAMAVLGVIKGFNALPAEMRDGIRAIEDSLFIHTTYSFNKAVSSTYEYAVKLIAENGGKAGSGRLKIKKQKPSEPGLEVSFPDLVYDKTIPVFGSKEWVTKGQWKVLTAGRDNQVRNQSLWSDTRGDEMVLTFTGTGISLDGNWYRNGGKADIYIDGILNRSIDTYYYFAGQQHSGISLWHITGLEPGEHTLRLVVTGEKRPESEGTRIYITGARIFMTAVKKNENYLFSFEK